MNIHAAIIEDNSEIIETLKYTLAQLPLHVTLIEVAQTAEDAFHALKNAEVELAFLDIQLRDASIFEVLEKLFKEGYKLPELVFITAHGSFENALKAIQFACLDFVTKPFDTPDIEAAVRRYAEKKNSQQQNQQTQIGFLLQLLRGDLQTLKSIAIALPKGVIELVDLQQIVYIQADENISHVHLSDGKILHSTRHLGHYLELFNGNPDFIQISKSCLVNLCHLRQYNHQDKSLKLKTNESLVVSHRFSRILHKFLLNSQHKHLIGGSQFNFLKNLFKS
ncbi:MAG: response regulator transcription factor [Saprospiraceae bacterium]|nr:response regulator transcription factor [Saprospiraceae bacterium]